MDDYCNVDAYLGTMEDVESSNPWYTSLKIKHENIRFKIYNCADLTFIPEDEFRKFEKYPFRHVTKRLFGPGQKELNVQGSFTNTFQ